MNVSKKPSGPWNGKEDEYGEQMKREAFKINLILFWEFFKIGMFTIGGGGVMIPLIEDMVVRKKGWLDNEEIIDCIAISQSLPGAIAVSAATYIGKRRAGMMGACSATFGVVLPSFLVITLVMTFLGQYIDDPHVQGAFIGIKAAMCGLIAATAFRLGERVCKNPLHLCLAVGGFIAVGAFDFSAMWTVIAAGIIGLAAAFIKGKAEGGKRDEKEPKEEDKGRIRKKGGDDSL